MTMSDGSMVSGWTQNKQADRHNVSYDPGAAIRISGEGAQFIMNGGTITGNTNTKVINTMASSCIQILDGASFQMHGGSITGNGKDAMDGTRRDNSTLGGGVYVSAATFTMTGGIISDNEAQNGGGVYLTNDAVFTMTGGSIERNTLCSRGNPSQGGGVYVGPGVRSTWSRPMPMPLPRLKRTPCTRISGSIAITNILAGAYMCLVHLP